MSDFASIILCANPRSGSTMLCDMMSATGALGRPASYYRKVAIPDWASRLGVDHQAGSEEFERAYLAAIRDHGTDTSGMFGLRLMWDTVEGLKDRLSLMFPDQESDAALFECAFGRPFYVHLVREDKVAQAVSLVRAKQSGQWHLASDGSIRQGARNPSPISYDPQAIAKEVAALTHDDAAWEGWFKQQNLTPVHVGYENLARDPQKVMTMLLEAVGHDPSIAKNVEPGTSRMADEKSHEWIDQYRTAQD